jgi:hypothetical protein
MHIDNVFDLPMPVYELVRCAILDHGQRGYEFQNITFEDAPNGDLLIHLHFVEPPQLTYITINFAEPESDAD